MTKYICKIKYSDKYINIKPGDTVRIKGASVTPDGVPIITIAGYDAYGSINLSVFKFCFEELKDD